MRQYFGAVRLGYRATNNFFANFIFLIVLIVSLSQLGAAAVQPVFVQEKDRQITTGTSNAVVFASPTTAGNLIVVYLIWDNRATATVTDSLGNSYVSAGPALGWSNGRYSTQIFYAINGGQGRDTVTATFSTRINLFGIAYVHEYSGISTSAPLDSMANATGAFGSLKSGPANTTTATDLLFAGGVSASTVTAPGVGFTARSRAQGNMTEDRIVTTQGAYSATASNSGGAWGMQLVAFHGAMANGTLDTTAPSVPTGLSAKASSSTTIDLSWTASTDPDNASSSVSYGILRNGVRVATTAAGVTSFTDSGLTPSTTYSYTIFATDAAGNSSAQTAPVSAATSASQTQDTQPPSVAITSPGNNQTVSGTVIVAATAMDNVGVVGVQFQLDGGNLGAEVTSAPYNVQWITNQSTNSTHILTAIARDAAGNRTTSGGISVTVSNGGAHATYNTNFPLSENPISENGSWTNGLADGLDWGDVRTTPGLAFGTRSGSFADSTAVLTGTWSPDQMAQATVHSINQTDSLFEEVELRLRTTITPHSITGYEINFRCSKTSNAYSQIVRWNGPLGNFTYLASQGGSQFGVKDGDVIKATMIGNVITVYLNGVQINQATDNTFTSGNPGVGFYLDTSANVYSDYGITTYMASDVVSGDTTPPSVPANLVANVVSSSQIDLTWSTSTDDVAVAGYQIFRNGTQLGTSSTASYADKTAVPGVQYTYTVDAFDTSNNTSAQSASVVTATSMTPDIAPPSVPTNLQSSKITSSSLTITWTSSTDDVAVAGYQIFRNGAQIATTSTASFSDTGLSASTTYGYTVAAYDSSGNVSAQSQPLSVTTSAIAVAPPSLIQVANNQISSGSSVSVSFNSATQAGNTIVAYVIWSNNNSVALTDSSLNNFTSVSAPITWGNGYSAQVFYASNIPGGADTIKANFKTLVNSFGVVYVHEYAGISASSPVDVTASAIGSSTTLNSGTVMTTSANDLIFGAGVSDNTVTKAGTGFSARDLAYGNITEDSIASAVGQYSATAAHNGKIWGMQVVAFRAAR